MLRERKKKRWSDLSVGARTAIVLGGLAEVVMTTVAWRDLVRRAPQEIRGPKPLWGAALFVQPVGSPLYLLVGRRHAPA